MTLKLYNTLTRRKETFDPRDPSSVRMYVCGPTVYQRIHIGNARPLVVFDVLFRLLRHLYGEDKVTYVRNITDIDDRIIDQARKDGVNGDLNAAIRDLTDRTTEAFRDDWRALGCLPPTHEPRATDHIPGMIRIIGELVAKGHAYEAEGHVLFDVPSMPDYGRLSGRSTDDMIAGARVEVAPYKKHPADFVLWKPSTPDLPGWESPWGRGRPGWHIECSAMSEAFLGPLPFDIHGGGQDLIFPHHENELAQSRCAHGIDAMASIWMHNGFVDMAGEKMSKSLGNVISAHEALTFAHTDSRKRGETMRLWLLTAHYRQPLDHSPEMLLQTQLEMDGLYHKSWSQPQWPNLSAEPYDEVVDALLDDLNTPLARARLFAVSKFAKTPIEAAKLRASANLLGLLQVDPQEWSPDLFRAFDLMQHGKLRDLIEARRRAREAKDFATADALRDRAMAMGFRLVDLPDGTTEPQPA